MCSLPRPRGRGVVYKPTLLLAGFCILATLILFDLFPTGSDGDLSSSPEFTRRNLQARKSSTRRRRRRHRRKRKLNTDGGVYPWAEQNLKSISEVPDPANEVALFWHIPKAGGTTVKSIYECLDLKIATRAGGLERFGHAKDMEIKTFRPWGQKGPVYVNVDTTSFPGILRAERLGLVPSGVAELIFTSFPNYAVTHLYDEQHKGRALAIFRHPVDRLVSKFYFLQVADWQSNYSPGWAKMTVAQWARNVNRDNNSYVKQLAGLQGREKPTEEHLQLAMETIKDKFVVGLTDKMEESIRRFNIFLGIKESEERGARCMNEFFGGGEVKKNSNSHPKIEEDNAGWQILADANSLDIKLWNYVLQLFEEQKNVVDSHASTTVA